MSGDKRIPSNSDVTSTSQKNAVQKVARDFLISFDYLQKDKNTLNANSYPDKRNQTHNLIINRKQSLQPLY